MPNRSAMANAYGFFCWTIDSERVADNDMPYARICLPNVECAQPFVKGSHILELVGLAWDAKTITRRAASSEERSKR